MAQNKSLSYVCYDQDGTTTGAYFYNWMVTNGFTSVYYIQGGLNAWNAAGYPMSIGDDGGRVNGIGYPVPPGP